MFELFKKKKGIITKQKNLSTTWIDELADRFSSLADGFSAKSIAEIIKAAMLLHKNSVKMLYRYRRLDKHEDYTRLIDFLDSGNLYCSKQKDLNDPFDLRSPLTDAGLDYLDKDTIATSKMLFIVFIIIIIVETAKDNGDDLAKNTLDEMLTNMSVKSEDIKDVIQKVFEVVEQKEGAEIKDADTEQMYSILAYDKTFNNVLAEHFLRDPYSTIHEALDEVGLACFTESSSNMPMWWHYASERKGVCLEFNMKSFKPPFSEVYMLPVRYVEILPDLTSKILKKSGKMNLHYALIHVCMHKHLTWSYEREWRAINLRNLADKKYDRPEMVNFVKPTKIILGDKIEVNHMEGICEAAKRNNILATQMEIKAIGYSEKYVFNPKGCK